MFDFFSDFEIHIPASPAARVKGIGVEPHRSVCDQRLTCASACQRCALASMPLLKSAT